MKKIFWIISIVAASSSWSYAQNQDPYHDNNNSNDDTYYDNGGDQQADDGSDGMSYQTFYDQLSPYGSWVNYPGYGYVWVPQADGNFAPYQTEGEWQYSDAGWVWVSDYPWGWATFHYGRWFYDPSYGGWLWMPGYDWAPAWVTWGNYGGYYCWTPIGPRDFVNGRWGYGAYDHHWFCLPHEHMGEHGSGRYIVRNEVVDHDRAHFERNIAIVNHTNTYGRSVYNAGPKVEEVQKATGRTITHMSISNTSKPGKTEVHGNSVNIYRPSISKNTTQHAVPTRVVNPTEVNHDATPTHNATPGRNEAPHNNNTNPSRNNTPARSNPTPSAPERTMPNLQRPQPSHDSYTPPRQSPPVQQSRPSGGGGGFIPSSRPSMPSPAPSFHAPSGGGMGGGARGGGGRH